MNSARFSPPSIASLTPSRGEAVDPETESSLLTLLRTLWRGKWLILLVTLCAVFAMATYLWRVAVPLYTATAVVSLLNRNEQVVDLESIISGIGTDQASVNTEVEVLRSRGLLEKLVDRLDLQSDPEFNPYLRPERQWSLNALSNLVRGPREPEEPPSARVIRDKTVDAVRRAIWVENIRQSYVFRITSQTQEPEKSALLADTLADLYILDQLEMKFEATEKATEWLTDRVSQLKTELDQAETAVQVFNSEIQLISPERLVILNAQLKDFRDRNAGLVEKLQRLRSRIAALIAAGESGDSARMTAVADTPALTQLYERLVAGDDSARVLFERQFEQVLERARLDAQRLENQIETLSTTITNLQRQVSEQSRQALKLEQFRREAEASRLIYEYFLGRLKETSGQQGTQQADARVLSYATLPLEPSSPQKAMLLALAILFGLMIGAVLVFLLEMRKNAFRTPEEMQEGTGVTVIGQIPRAPFANRKRLLNYIVSKPTSAMVEAVRNLRTSILLSPIDRVPKIIMMTSSVPGEGKTMLSLALAHNLSSMEKRVLVIEGDIRRRTFRELFDVPDKRGLITAVVEQVPIEEVVHYDETLGLDILMGERVSINAADFFSSRRFAEFLTQVRDAYDFVVIDTPPVLMVPDARIIAQYSDALIYVVHWDSTPRRQVQQGLESFATVRMPVTGLVMTQIDPRGMKRYGYSGVYGQGYGSRARAYHES